jgi:hypothetical protein
MEEKHDYIHIRASGDRTRENVITMTIGVFNAAVEKGFSKVLIDIRELAGYFGFMDIFFLVKEVLVNFRGKGVDRVAVIDVHQTNRKDWFLEPVANSYGLNIRVFEKMESAEHWLGEKPSAPVV